MATPSKSSPVLPSRRKYWLAALLNRVEITPARITAAYLLFGFAALYLSDVILVQLFADPVLSQLQTLKGGVEVLATGGLIYGLSRWSRSQVETRENRLRD